MAIDQNLQKLFDERVRSMKGTWQGARQKAKQNPYGERLPDGNYVAAITHANITQSQAGRLQVAWEYTVMEGEFSGQPIRDYDGLETEQNLEWLTVKLARLGYNVEQLEMAELPELLEDIVTNKPVLRLRLKSKGDYQNAYIDRVLQELSDPPRSSAAPVEQTAPEPVVQEVAPEPEELPDPFLEPAFEVGCRVEFRKKPAEVVRLTDDGRAVVRQDGAKITHVVAMEELTLLDEENGTEA